MKIKVLLAAIALGMTNFILAQDKLVSFGNETKNVKVIEITPTEVKYKAFENLTGPLYSIPKTDVVCIVYENGVVEVLQQKPKTLEELLAQKKAERKAWRKENIPYRNSFGQDFFALIPGFSDYNTMLGISSFGFNYERRSKKQFMAHKIGVYALYTQDNKGSFYFNYSPKIFFNKHRIIRGFAGPEVALGYYTHIPNYYYYVDMYGYSNYYQGPRKHQLYSHLGTTIGMNIYPKERMHIIFDLTMGGKIMQKTYNSEQYYYNQGRDSPFFWRLGMTMGFNF